jgi:hypothetical protein
MARWQAWSRAIGHVAPAGASAGSSSVRPAIDTFRARPALAQLVRHPARPMGSGREPCSRPS